MRGGPPGGHKKESISYVPGGAGIRLLLAIRYAFLIDFGVKPLDMGM